MLQPAYINGFERRSFAALGRTLYPLTLGHAHLLLCAESPLVIPGKPLSQGDVATAVAICMFEMWEQAAEVINHGDSAGLIPIADLTDEDFTAASIALIEYAEYYLASPKSGRESKDQQDVAIPWTWAYAEFLQSVVGRDEVAAWATICCDAFALFAAHSTRNGNTDFYTPRMIWFLDNADNLEKQFEGKP
jgi:hypothetical protein